MILWPVPVDDLLDWARALIDALKLQEISINSSDDVGHIGEFVKLPSTYLEATGATFDQASYPVLYQRLGTNVLPTLTPQYAGTNKVGIKAV